MRVNRHSQQIILKVEFTTAWSSTARIRLSAFQILGVHTTTLLQFSCAQQFLANTIYSILPTFPRKTWAAVAGVKMGLL